MKENRKRHGYVSMAGTIWHSSSILRLERAQREQKKEKKRPKNTERENSNHHIMPNREALIEPVRSLLSALSDPHHRIEDQFTSQPKPQIYEHGLPLFAPFMGRTFSGKDGIGKYFDLLAATLVFQETKFEDQETWIVDDSSKAVFLCGQCRFLWKETGETWDETFCYRIAIAEDLDDSSRKLKVSEYKVWGDSGALYLASLGKLGLVSRNDPVVKEWLGKGRE